MTRVEAKLRALFTANYNNLRYMKQDGILILSPMKFSIEVGGIYESMYGVVQ